MKITGAFSALLMLLQISLQHTEAAADALKPSDELKHLRDVVYQQGTMLVELKTEMKYLEKENAVLKNKMAKQVKQGKEIQGNMENMKNTVSAQAEEVSTTKSKLTGEVEKLTKQNEEIRTALAARESEVKGLKKENTALKGRVSTAEGDVESLKREIIDFSEHPKVAFSAALKSTTGFASSEMDLVFPTVITNVGGAYNPNTGVFTAPARGVYYFRYTVFGSGKNYNSGISLYKNQEVLTFVYAWNHSGYGKFMSGGFTVHLEFGDAVRVRLPKDYLLYHQGTNSNTFSGFMIFPI